MSKIVTGVKRVKKGKDLFRRLEIGDWRLSVSSL
jgi:hypothetical protein